MKHIHLSFHTRICAHLLDAEVALLNCAQGIDLQRNVEVRGEMMQGH